MQIVLRTGILACIIIFLTVLKVFGQQHLIQVIDSKTGEAIPYAHVCFESLDSDKEIHAITSMEGTVPNTIEGRAVVAISYVGYETLYDTVSGSETRTFFLKPTIFNMNELVVTAQYTPQRVDKSIYKVNVIGKKQIEQKGANNLAELFTSELSIRVNQDGALGSSMSIRGLSGEHVKFLVDGIPMIGRMNGNIDLGQLNLYNVDHIEFIEGPMSVVYGSNALAGVVNIITKENKNTPLIAGVETYVESVGTFNINANASIKKNRNVFSLSGGRNFFGGYSVTDGRSMTWKPKRQYLFDGYYIYDHQRYKFKFTTSFFNELLLNQGDVIEPHYAIDSYFTTNRFNNSLDFSSQIGKTLFVKALASYSIYERRKETYFKNLHTLEEVPSENDGDQDTTRFYALNVRAEISRSSDERRLDYQAGIDINDERGSGKRIKDQEQYIGDYAAFVTLKYRPVPVLIIQPGLRLIYNTRYNAPLVYSVNLRYSITELITARASYSRGFRAPSLKELYLYFVDVNHNIQGNDNLKAEDSHNFILDLGYKRERGKAAHGISLDLFYNSINNIITIAQINNTLYSYINIDNYVSKGFQLELFYELYPNLRWKIGLAETGRKNTIEGEEEKLKNFFYSTDLNTSITYMIRKWNFDASIFYKYNGRLPQYYQNTEGELEEGYIEDYHTMDITLNKHFFNRTLTISAGIKNLFDVKAVNATGATAGGVHSGGGSSLVGYGRSYFISLSYGFRKF
jgi:outer membrane receptor for ferrienterochelin and colicins